jgi:nucleoid DNA-binding protein
LYFLKSRAILLIGSEVVTPLYKPGKVLLGKQATCVDSCKEEIIPMAEDKSEQAATQTVGRQELSKRIAKQAKLSQKQASEVLEATLTAIREALQEGDEVRLVGFGSFKVRQSAARKGVNPRDRQPIEVPAKERVRFFPGKELSEAVIKK